MINKPYKFKRTEFDQIYFTSDTHYGHDPKWDIPLWKRRGFDSVDDHDRWLDDQFSKISDKSIIFHLGDAALNSTPEKMLNLFNKTSAPIWFIFGNHFSPDYALYKSSMNKWLSENVNRDDNIVGFDVVEPLKYEIYPFNINRFVYKNIGQYRTTGSPPEYFVDGNTGASIENYTLTYLGIQANIQIDKTFIQLSHMCPKIWTRGAISLFGHSHGELSGVQPEDADMKLLDCGIENSIKYNNSAFFTFEEIQDIMSKKSNKTFDTHS